MRAAAILLAAGAGRRLGVDLPKGFVTLDGGTLLEHALRAVDPCPGIELAVCAVPPGLEERARELADPPGKLGAVVAGGGSRQESVRIAMGAVPSDYDALVVHDVARPFAAPSLFQAVLDALAGADGAVPVVPIADTVKRTRDGSVAETVSRDGLVLVQTPQGFRREALERAHRRAGREGYRGTDDAALLERAGFTVAAVPGDPANIKVTTARDLDLARALAPTLLR